MKLGEALLLKAELEKKSKDLLERVIRNARVEEGAEPAELPAELLNQFEGVEMELCTLNSRIRHANQTVMVNGSTIAHMLNQRRCLEKISQEYNSAAGESYKDFRRLKMTEIREETVLDVALLRKSASKFAKERRLLNLRIQNANWAVDI